jgi:hypothetical protein
MGCVVIVLSACRQARGYDPWSPREAQIAKELNMPWDCRGPGADDEWVKLGYWWRCQQPRPDGSCRTRGGKKMFLKKAAKVFRLSGYQYRFSNDNPQGGMHLALHTTMH